MLIVQRVVWKMILQFPPYPIMVKSEAQVDMILAEKTRGKARQETRTALTLHARSRSTQSCWETEISVLRGYSSDTWVLEFSFFGSLGSSLDLFHEFNTN